MKKPACESGPLFVYVWRIELAGFLPPIAVRKDYNVVVGNLASRAPVPPAMNDARPAPNAVGAPIPVIAEANVMNAPHLLPCESGPSESDGPGLIPAAPGGGI